MDLELGDTVYSCLAEVHGDFDLESYQGKEVDAKVQGKTILIKRENGKILKYPILKIKKNGCVTGKSPKAEGPQFIGRNEQTFQSVWA
jgi:hypothetical protein